MNQDHDPMRPYNSTLYTASIGGVYGLDLLRFLAGALNVPYRPAMGRGFEARSILQAPPSALPPRRTHEHHADGRDRRHEIAMGEDGVQ